MPAGGSGMGRPSRFLALYDRHFARIHRYARLRLDEPAKAEDATSEVFLTALAKLESFSAGAASPPGSFASPKSRCVRLTGRGR